MFHAHGDGGIAIAPQDVAVIEPAIAEPGIFGGAHQIACALGFDEALERDAEFHERLPLCHGLKFDQPIKFLGRRSAIVNRNCAPMSN
ncbi:hypothetical protein D3C87_1962970 [compost metagenome]